jgi:hypothetical protein
MKPFVDDKGRSLSQAPLEENTAGKRRAGDPSVPQKQEGRVRSFRIVSTFW